jgi:hypothetical protein
MSTHSILVGVCELRMETRKELTQQIIIWAGLKCAHPVGPSTILSWIGYTQPVAISALVFFSVKKTLSSLKKRLYLALRHLDCYHCPLEKQNFSSKFF